MLNWWLPGCKQINTGTKDKNGIFLVLREMSFRVILLHYIYNLCKCIIFLKKIPGGVKADEKFGVLFNFFWSLEK